MKKWLMLAFLPFLLLVQQEVGATIYASTSKPGATYGYEMKFDGFDTIKKSFDYFLTFYPPVDLNSIPLPPSGTGTGTCSPNCTTVPGSLIQAGITDRFGNPIFSFVDLAVNSSGEVTGNQSNDNLTRFVSVSSGSTGGTIKGTYFCTVDSSGRCPPFFSEIGILRDYTYIQTKSMLDDGISGSELAPITKVNVPVANSFMLLGIGLMALGMPLYRGKLS